MFSGLYCIYAFLYNMFAMFHILQFSLDSDHANVDSICPAVMISYVGTTIKNTFTVGGRLFSTPWGDVYAGTSVSRKSVIIKVERNPKRCILYKELRVYKQLRGALGFCHAYHYGWSKGHPVLVVERLGPSLKVLLAKAGGSLSTKTIALVAIQVLCRLEVLHDVGFLHCNLHPGSIVFGPYGEAQPRKLYLTGFQYTQKFLQAGARHVEDGVHKSIAFGAWIFAPIRAHKGLQCSRRDDLESLIYLLAYLSSKKPIWSKQISHIPVYSPRVMGRMKLRLASKKLFSNMPPQMTDFLEYVRKLKFEERPNYRYLRLLMREILYAQNDPSREEFDWNVK